MNADELKNFIALNKKIANLKAVKCRLTHERVKFDAETNLPVAESLPELGYERVGLCPPEIRSERLACGHTMARYLLEDALSILAENGVETDDLKTGLDEATCRIHSLDHEKGFADKHLAQMIEKKYVQPESDFSKEIQTARDAIKNIENQHTEYVEKIANVRDLIISKMQFFIENQGKV